MPEWSSQWMEHILFALSRWLHLVSMTLLVGGTLFFEFVVPEAIDDLKEEQQLSVFARSRWVFRRITWLCAALLPITGGISMFRLWSTYRERSFGFLDLNVSGYWMATHVLFAILAITLAVHVVLTNARPGASRLWMQLNLILLLAVMFMAVAARHVRLTIRERERDTQRAAAQAAQELITKLSTPATNQGGHPPGPATGPATFPATEPSPAPTPSTAP